MLLFRMKSLAKIKLASLLLSVHFNGHFPGEPRLADTRMSRFWILLELRMMLVVVITGAIRRVKLQSSHHHQQTNTQLFYRLDVLPVPQPTASEHWRESITLHGLTYPKLTWGLPTLSLTTTGSWRDLCSAESNLYLPSHAHYAPSLSYVICLLCVNSKEVQISCMWCLKASWCGCDFGLRRSKVIVSLLQG